MSKDETHNGVADHSDGDERPMSNDSQESTTKDYHSSIDQPCSNAPNLGRKLIVRIPTKSLIIDVFVAPARIYGRGKKM